MQTSSTDTEPKSNRTNSRAGKKNKRALWFANMVPPGPYKTQQEKFYAVSKYEDYLKSCVFEDSPPLNSTRVKMHMRLSQSELKSIINSHAYKEMRLAEAKVEVGSALADLAPKMRETFIEVLREAKGSKEKKEALELIIRASEKYGLTEVDTAKATIGDELNVDEALNEALGIIEKLTGISIVVQKFCKALKDGDYSTYTRKEVRVTEAGNALPPVEDSIGNRPDDPVETSTSPEETDVEQKEVPDDDRGEPLGQDRLVDG